MGQTTSLRRPFFLSHWSPIPVAYLPWSKHHGLSHRLKAASSHTSRASMITQKLDGCASPMPVEKAAAQNPSFSEPIQIALMITPLERR
jgi:hypothetical protein